MADVACNHDWETKRPNVKYCCHCDAIHHDAAPQIRISVRQSASLGFKRSLKTDLLVALEQTFGEEAFDGTGERP